MKQHFRGRFHGHYVGTPPDRGEGKAAFQVQIYQGTVEDLTFQDPPLDTVSPTAVRPALRQAELSRARLVTVPGRGHSYDAHLFDLELSEPRFAHPARHAGRIYGSITGTVTGWFNLPPEPPPPEAVEPTTRVAAPKLARGKGKTAPVAGDVSALKDGLSPEGKSAEDQSDEEDAASEELVAETSEGGRKFPAIPLVVWVIALSIALLMTCGAATLGLWLLFLVPTLVLRRFLRGVLEDSTPMRAIASALVLAQLGWTSWLLVEWSTSPCKELHIIPVLGLIAGVFLSGILPFSAPFTLNAVSFALVLWSFGSEPSAQCNDKPAPVETQRAPSVKDPGVPRTGPDGRWPRTPTP